VSHDQCRRFDNHPDGIDAAGLDLMLQGDGAFYQSDLGIVETEAWCRDFATNHQPPLLRPGEGSSPTPSPSTGGSEPPASVQCRRAARFRDCDRSQ
jgi:hypothetical protein